MAKDRRRPGRDPKLRRNASPVRKRGPSAAEEFASESQYLKGLDVKKPFDAEIAGIDKVKFDDGNKWVLHLEGCKSLVLNKTNGRALAADLGDDLDEWVGQRIHVFVEKRRNPSTNQMVPGIAVCGASVDGADEDDDKLPLVDDVDDEEDDEDEDLD
jgi:hypothetical protein